MTCIFIKILKPCQVPSTIKKKNQGRREYKLKPKLSTLNSLIFRSNRKIKFNQINIFFSDINLSFY